MQGDVTISKLVKDLGIAAVPHSFQPPFLDWAAEQTNHPRKIIEAALARSALFEGGAS